MPRTTSDPTVRLARRPVGALLRILILALLLAYVAGPGAAGAAVSLGGWMAHSPDDLSGVTTLTGNDATDTSTSASRIFSGRGVTASSRSLPSSQHTTMAAAMPCDDAAPRTRTTGRPETALSADVHALADPPDGTSSGITRSSRAPARHRSER